MQNFSRDFICLQFYYLCIKLSKSKNFFSANYSGKKMGTDVFNLRYLLEFSKKKKKFKIVFKLAQIILPKSNYIIATSLF